MRVKEARFIRQFLDELKNNIYRPRKLVKIMEDQITNDLKNVNSEIHIMQFNDNFDQKDSHFTELLKIKKERETGLRNLKEKMWIEYYNKKEEAAWTYYKIRNIEEIKEKCLYCMMLVQEAIWINYSIILDTPVEKVMKGLIGFFQHVYGRIDDEDEVILITEKPTFDVIIRDFSFLIDKYEELFDRGAQPERIPISPNEALRKLPLDERHELLSSLFDVTNYLESLDNEELKSLFLFLLDKLSKENQNKFLMKISKIFDINNFTLLNLIDKLTIEEKKVIMDQLPRIITNEDGMKRV